MIQQQTVLKVIDNSGAKTAKCIKVLGGFKKQFAKVGDFIIVSIQKLRNRAKETSRVSKGEIFKGIIVQTKRKKTKKDGSNFYMLENSIVLINKQGNPVATRILGPIPRLLKKKNIIKFASLSPGFY